jgi:endonuclease-3
MDEKTALKQLKLLQKKGGIMRLAAEKWPSKFQTLISIILSARTRDETTIRIAKELFKKYPTVKKFADAKIDSVEKIIRPVNFYRNKSKNIILCSKKIVEEYKSEVPESIEELVKLPGVGRKTSNVFLAEYGGDAIGVDTHLSYCSQKLNWTLNKDPHKIELDLEKLFHKRYWKELNSTLVRFGKKYTSRREKDRILEEIKKIR